MTHNEWDPATKTSRPKVLHSFGREDQLDREAIKRLVGVADPAAQPGHRLTASTNAGPAGLAFTSLPRRSGGTLVLDALWRRLGIDTVMTAAAGRAASATRAPSGCCSRWSRTGRWRRARSWPPPDGSTAAPTSTGLPETSDDACYRAMDWLLDIAAELEQEVFWQVADPARPRGRPAVLRHHLHLLRDRRSRRAGRPRRPARPDRRSPPPDGRPTTGRHRPAAGGTADGVGFRTYGKSKDSRDDLPQVVIGMAVTSAGIPVRVWCWPGNTTDSALIRQAREDMRDWTLARVMWVADRGFSSAENRR